MSSADTAGGNAFFGCAYCHEAFPEKHQAEVHHKAMHTDLAFKSVAAPMPARETGLLHKAPTAAISKNVPLSEVNRHCIPEDCWVAVEGKVYDLTEFMDRHPGGPTTILNSAGKDATKIFKEIHKGIKIEQYLRPGAIIGDLGVDESLMSEDFWHTLRKARISEVREELQRLEADLDAHSLAKNPGGGEISTLKSTCLLDLMQEKGLSSELKAKLQTLETQKRVALDAEDFIKAQEIKVKVDALIAEAYPSASWVSQAPAEPGAVGIPLSEVARHNKPHDCWVALNGSVYDLTDFLQQHPEQRNVVLSLAGRDASPMWNKIPGRFPSATWNDFYLRPEARMGDIGPEPNVDPKLALVRELRSELRRLEGPSDEDIQAAKAGAQDRRGGVSEAAAAQSEEARFPKLRGVAPKKELPFFTRAEVAKHKGPPGGAPGTEPYMILHNKVYDLTPLIGSHPGGDEMVLSRAGTDCTKDFELFEHSEKARVRRDQDMLVGEIVPAERSDWGAEAVADVAGGVAASVEGMTPEAVKYLRYKAMDVAMAGIFMYAAESWKHRKPLSMLTYSRGLRHLHLIMAVGIFGALGSAQAASYSEGLAKKRWLQIHKQTGLAMLFAMAARIAFRLRSGIPPRFPGHPVMMAIETMSLRAFYALMLVIPISGVANEYFLKYAPSNGTEDDSANDKRAQQSITIHKRVANFFEYVWLPFHLGYTSVYHYANGRGVVRKVSPFI